MPNRSNFENQDFLRLNAANLFVPGDEEQRILTIQVLAEAGFHPVRHNVDAVRIERIDGQDCVFEGEFIAIAALGQEEKVEKMAQERIDALGLSTMNSQLLWATSSLEIFNIKGKKFS